MSTRIHSSDRHEDILGNAAADGQFRKIWEDALQEYDRRTGNSLPAVNSIHQAVQLEHFMARCETSTRNERTKDTKSKRLREGLKLCIMPLKVLSPLAAGALSLTPFAPAATIFGAGMFLIEASEAVSNSLDLVEELLRECRTFAERLADKSKVSMGGSLARKCTIILTYILQIFADCEEVLKKGRLKIWGAAVFGKKKDEVLKDSLEKLQRHFQEEEMYTVDLTYVKTEIMLVDVGKLVSSDKMRRVRRVVESLPDGVVDVAAKQAEHISKCESTQPDWVMTEKAYIDWVTKTKLRHKWLWILGSVGTGKTTVASYIALNRPKEPLDLPQYLVNTSANDDSSQRALQQSAVALFYGDYDRKGEQDPDYVFQSLARQLLNQLQMADINRAEARCVQIEYLRNVRTDAAEPVAVAHGDDEKARAVSTSNLTWSSFLNDLASEFKRTYIIIDALDKEEAQYRDLLARLSQMNSPGIKLLVTSREDRSMRDDAVFLGAQQMTITAGQEIIEGYVRSRLERIRDSDAAGLGTTSALPQWLQNGSNFAKVIQTITPLAHESFYYAEACVNLLQQEREVKELEHKLEALADADGLSKVIRINVDQIHQQIDLNKRELGIKVIMLAISARRSLSINEFKHAIVLLMHPNAHSNRQLLRSKMELFTVAYLQECTCGLLRFSEAKGNDGTIGIDEQIKNYCSQSDEFSSAHREIAEVCLTLLDRASFALVKTDRKDRQVEYPFYEYAAQNWGHHVRDAGEILFLQESSAVPLYTLLKRRLFCNVVAMALHEEFQRVRTWNWAGNDSWKAAKENAEHVVPAVHLLIYFDLPRTLHWWLRQHPDDVNRKSATGTTPLYLSSLLGRVQMTEILLFDFYANPLDLGSPPSGYCLAGAVTSQNADIVERILHVDPNTLRRGNWHGRRPLSEAAARGDTKILRMLIDATLALPDGESLLLAGDKNGYTALHDVAAASQPSNEVISMLLQAKGGGGFLQRKTIDWQDSPLHIAARDGHDDAVEHLLQCRADPLARQKLGLTPLMVALANLFDRTEKTIKVLMRDRSNIQVRDNSGFSIWHVVAYEGRIRNLELLMKLTSEPALDVLNQKGETPLRVAAVSRRGAWAFCIVTLLRHFQGRISQDDAYAVLNGLIPDCQDSNQNRRANEALQLLVTQHPVESWPYCRGNTTLLHKTLHHGSLEKVQTVWGLLGRDQRKVLESRDAGGSTPLMLAAGYSLPIEAAASKVVFLVDQGADINALDPDNRTALHHCIMRDIAEAVAHLLGKGAVFGTLTDGASALGLIKDGSQCSKLPQVIAAKQEMVRGVDGAK